MASGLIPGTPVGQLFSRSSQPSTPTLQDIQENNLGGVSSGHAMSQLHPENSQVMSPNSPGPIQPLYPAPSTPPLALGVGAPTTPPSLAQPQLSLVPRATPMTPPVVSPRSPALSYERMQVFIQQSEDRASVYQARALSEQNLFTEKRELEEHYHVRWREAMEGLYSEANVQIEQQLNYFEAEQRQYYHSKWQMLQAQAQEMWEKSRAESVTQTVRSEQEFSARLRSEEQQMRTRHRQVELTLENQAAELAEQLRSTNTLLQEESAQMLEQGNALRQELHNQAFTHYVEESQVSTLRNNLEHQQKRSHNEEQQFQAAKRQFHEQKVTLQNMQREVQRLTRSEATLQQQYAMQVRTLTQERDQERLSLESVVSTRDEQHQQLHDTLAEHLQHYEEEEQKYAEDWQILRTEVGYLVGRPDR